MKVVIIEDEPLAAEKLEHYLQKYDASIEVMAKLPSISTASTWLREHLQDLDLVFMDIQLSDGLSFEIFHEVTIDKPVIFTTAFDEYAVDAFKVNSIDYLLKPITFTALSHSLKKLKTFQTRVFGQAEVKQVMRHLEQKSFKDRFLVKRGNHIQTVKETEISFFLAEGRTVFLFTNEGKKYIVEYKLEELEKLLDPRSFNRINRSFIVHINAIEDILVYSNSRLKIMPNVSIEKEMIVSREKVGTFKTWLEGGR